MTTITTLSKLQLSQIDTLVFAGGGNRCWWQAGLVSEWLAAGARLPAQLVGTSAGAAVAASLLIPGGPQRALEACKRLYGREERIFDWAGLARLRLRFAHQHIYPSWLAGFVDEHGLAAMRASGSQLTVALTRPARALGLAGSIVAGSLAYMVDKHVRNSIHPRLPRWLGLKQDFHSLQDCRDLDDAHRLLSAAAAAPPFMSAVHVAGRAAIDGGYTDNAPIPAQSEAQRCRTLVLLTRHYPHLPALFSMNGRSYLQPSCKVPVSTWDCTRGTPVDVAFELGQRDAAQLTARIELKD